MAVEMCDLIDLSIIIVHTSTFTFTQLSEMDSSSTAFTVSCARPFAVAVQEDGASFTGILVCCPVRQPNTIVFPSPPPFAEFLGELRLLDSSKNWSEAALTLYVQRELLVMVGCSPVFLPLVKRRCLASLTLAKPHPLLYFITTHRSSFCMWRDPRLKHDGALVSASSVSVRPGVLCQDAPSRLLATSKEV